MKSTIEHSRLLVTSPRSGDQRRVASLPHAASTDYRRWKLQRSNRTPELLTSVAFAARFAPWTQERMEAWDRQVAAAIKRRTRKASAIATELVYTPADQLARD